MPPLRQRDLAPTIIVDTREQQPLAFPGWKVERLGLWAGDYGLRGFSADEVPGGLPRMGIAVERKSIPDLYSTMTNGRERFEKEIKRLQYFDFAAIVIGGEPNTLRAYCKETFRQGDPEAVLASLRSFQINDGIHVEWAGDPEGAAYIVGEWFRLFAQREYAMARRAQRHLTNPPPVECMDDGEAREIAEAAAQASGATGTGGNTNENTGE